MILVAVQPPDHSLGKQHRGPHGQLEPHDPDEMQQSQNLVNTPPPQWDVHAFQQPHSHVPLGQELLAEPLHPHNADSEAHARLPSWQVAAKAGSSQSRVAVLVAAPTMATRPTMPRKDRRGVRRATTWLTRAT
jgi:hypothetical protein